MSSDVVVIGGGMAGLATGALLSKRGYGVTVLEKGNQAGGRAYTYADQGFTLNYGPHALYRPDSGALAGLLARLGHGPLTSGYPEPMRSYWADGERWGTTGAKPHQLLATKLFGVRHRLALVAALAALRFADADRIDPAMTYGEWVDAHVAAPELRRFLRAIATLNTYTRPAGDLSARFLIAHFQRSLFAKDYVGYLDGGWASIYNVFADAIRAGGGAVITGAAVRELEMRGGAVVAAATDGARHEARTFVCAVPPQDAARFAPAGALGDEFARWASMQDVRACCIDLGFAHRVRTDLTLIFDVERDLYFSLHSEVTPGLAPPGGQLLHAMAYLSSEEAADGALAEARRQELIAGLDRHFPGWREATRVERTLPNVRVSPLLRTPGHAGVPLRSAAAANLYFAHDGRDLPYALSETSLRAAMEAAGAIVASIGTPASAPPAAIAV